MVVDYGAEGRRGGDNGAYFVYGSIRETVNAKLGSLTTTQITPNSFDPASLKYLNECYGLNDLKPESRTEVVLFALQHDEALKVTLRNGALTVTLSPEYKTLVGHVIGTSTEESEPAKNLARAVGE